MTGLALYDRTATAAAAAVIRAYSTSFGLATRLLGPRVRPGVRNVYALVRVADEVVDGPGAEAGAGRDELGTVLDALEAEVEAATERGFSTNLVVHAFARTARECGIGGALTGPFFASMRADLDITSHDDASHDDYVYGSAQVVGLMCLQVFLCAGAAAPRPAPGVLVEGATRLGAAFQDVNFLRDSTDDEHRLGRDYLGIAGGAHTRADVLDRIEADLDVAAVAIPLLPRDCRAAVTAAHDLFAELAVRLRRETDPRARVRVPDPAKARIALRAWAGGSPHVFHRGAVPPVEEAAA